MKLKNRKSDIKTAFLIGAITGAMIMYLIILLTIPGF